ncbi:FRG domain-containing protein [Pseudobacillus badius]|uniref:FRG domain-containing protein n=1 Tax=Bacillus badius TaxID=1455 RepID=UPI0007B3A30F|nr:FRG domain-containing protein [Bacillus badius]KZR57167.1 hypothetical protein A3781_20230 [Bacillus badius]
MYSEEWNNLLNEVADFQSGSLTTWFRGQSSSDFKLNSGLYRNKIDDAKSYLATERSYYSYFQRMGYAHHQEDDWNLLFIMQHHGVLTRLLDWSESFSVALFFAYENWNFKQDCAVWILDPLRLNEKVLNEKKFYIPAEKYQDLMDIDKPGFHDNSLALFPMRNNARIISQQGMFTLQGKLGVPLEEEFEGALIDNGILKKVKITPNLKKDVERFLKTTGTSSFSMFPDLDGLAKYINKLGYFRPRS